MKTTSKVMKMLMSILNFFSFNRTKVINAKAGEDVKYIHVPPPNRKKRPAAYNNRASKRGRVNQIIYFMHPLFNYPTSRTIRHSQLTKFN